MAGATVTVEEVRKAQRATGPATVLAIGTATPANCVHQADYPDYYFRITKSEHMTELKEKFKRMCEYLCLSHLALSPRLSSSWSPSIGQKLTEDGGLALTSVLRHSMPCL